MMRGIVHSGWLVSALLLLPNVLWMLFPSPRSPAFTIPRWASTLQPLETALRVAVFALPFFLSVRVTQRADRIAVLVAVAALALYYGVWLRYFGSGRTMFLLFAPWQGIPVPLALAPVAYLFAAAVLTRSWLLAGVTALFGATHVAVSLATANALRHAGTL